MKQEILLVTALAGLSGLGLAATPWRPDPPITCDSCAQWNAPHKPFRLFGNTYYVGVAGLSSLLITSDKGHILLDGGLPQSAALIDDNIARWASAPRTFGSSLTRMPTLITRAGLRHCSGAAVLR